MGFSKKNKVSKFLCLNYNFVTKTLNLLIICYLFQLTSQFVCPIESSIKPCRCFPASSRIFCSGTYITQEKIDNLIWQVGKVNKLSSSQKLYIPTLIIRYTNLMELNISSFTNCSFDLLSINNNPQLGLIVNPSLSMTDKVNNRFSSLIVEITSSLLSDKEIETILHSIQPQEVKELILSSNRIQGVNGVLDDHFMPVLSSFTQLRTLDLSKNDIKIIRNNPFNNQKMLSSLKLSGNPLLKVSSDAFDSLLNSNSDSIFVELDNTNLTLNKLNESHLLSSFKIHKKSIEISLLNNNLDNLPEELFKNFLYANEENKLWLSGNPFICNEMMSWIRRAKGDLEGQLNSVDCINDPDKTIFDTELVSSGLRQGFGALTIALSIIIAYFVL